MYYVKLQEIFVNKQSIILVTDFLALDVESLASVVGLKVTNKSSKMESENLGLLTNPFFVKRSKERKCGVIC